MSDITPLPSPSCGATSPDGDPCPSDSAAIVASEWPGYATAIWRCPDHIGASVETALRLSPEAIITVTPLAAIDDITDDTSDDSAEHADEPSPDPPTADRPTLQLVR